MGAHVGHQVFHLLHLGLGVGDPNRPTPRPEVRCQLKPVALRRRLWMSKLAISSSSRWSREAQPNLVDARDVDQPDAVRGVTS
jgi:hypothetical protein